MVIVKYYQIILSQNPTVVSGVEISIQFGL